MYQTLYTFISSFSVLPYPTEYVLFKFRVIQLSRYGYKDLDEMKAAVARVQKHGIPLDIPYADIDYMNRYKDFTTGDVSILL